MDTTTRKILLVYTSNELMNQNSNLKKVILKFAIIMYIVPLRK